MSAARSTRRRRSSESATILVAADWAPIRAFDAIVRDTPESVYGDLLPVMRTADLRIVNCECALTRHQTPAWKSGAVFKGSPAHVGGLTCVPFDVACLANNHVLDHGVAGLRETLRVLDRAGVLHVGAGLTEGEVHAPLGVSVGGVRVHVVNFSEGEDLTSSRDGGPGVVGWDIDRVVDTVRRCKRSGGTVIAIGHCGLEYVPFPPTYVVEAFRAIAEAGADVVVGHHPHVPQGIEWWHGTPIAYSLGNFAFYQPVDLHFRKTGYFLTLRVEGDAVTRLTVHPYHIGETALRVLSAGEHLQFRRDMARLSSPFASDDGPSRAWDAYLAWYGRGGFTTEVLTILERMKTERQKGAAMFRNRLTTMQHTELWTGTLTRLMRDGSPRPDAAAQRVVRDFFNRKART